MAKVTGPLFSITARGQIGKALIYSRWRNIDYVKKYAAPVQPNTPAQIAVRDQIRRLAQIWSNPPDPSIIREFHAYYITLQQMHELVMTGYNMFIRLYFPFDMDEAVLMYFAYGRESDDGCEWNQTALWGYCNTPNTHLYLYNEETGKAVTTTTDDRGQFNGCFPAEDWPAHSWVRLTCPDKPMPEIRFKIFDYDFGW